MTDSSIQELLGKISAEDILVREPLLLAELTCGRDVEDAVMYDPEHGGCEDLFLSSSMGCDDIEGLEDATVISRTENGEPLVELAFPNDSTVEAGDFEGFGLVVWNRSAQCMTIAGSPVEPGDFLMLSQVSGEELDLAMRTFMVREGGEWDAQ